MEENALYEVVETLTMIYVVGNETETSYEVGNAMEILTVIYVEETPGVVVTVISKETFVQMPLIRGETNHAHSKK